MKTLKELELADAQSLAQLAILDALFARMDLSPTTSQAQALKSMESILAEVAKRATFFIQH